MKCSIDDTMTVNEGLISYKINDMRVIGYMCYFCGVRKYSHNDPETGLHVTDSIGFLGRFHLDSLGFGQTVQYHLKLVRETKSLDRMATYAAGNDTVIAMIGIVDEPASQSCVAVARFDYPGSWRYIVKYAMGAEVFTDIASTNQTTVIASYYRNIMGKDYFFLRVNANSSLVGGGYSGLDARNKYVISSFPVTDTLYEIIRPDCTAVRLTAAPWDVVYAAFACRKNGLFPTYPTAVCSIRFPDKTMANMQIVKNAYTHPHTLVDMRYIYKNYGEETGAMVALLHNTDGPYRTVVEYPNSTIYTYGLTRVAPVRQLVDNQMHSLSVYNGNNIRFGGIWSSTMRHPTYLQETQPQLKEKDKCMYVSETDILLPNGTVQPLTSEVPLTIKDYNEKDLFWDKKNTTKTEVTIDNTCLKRDEESTIE